MNKYKIDQKTLEGLLSYLATKPFMEVSGLISTLTTLEIEEAYNKATQETKNK